MSNEGGRRSRTTVTVDGVTVDRYITPKSKGFVARYDVDAESEESVLVRIVDDFPDAFEVEDVEFEPSDALKRGEVTDSEALVEGVIPSDREMEVTYAAKLAEGKPRFISPPVVDEVYTFGELAMGEGRDGRGNETTNGATPPETDAVVATRTDTTRGDGHGGRGGHGVRAGDGATVPPTPSDGGEPFTDASSHPVATERDRSQPRSDESSESVGRVDGTSHQNGAETTDSLPAMSKSNRSDGARLVTRLLEEISSGTVSEGELAELRRRLGTDTQRSTDVKLQRLQAQVASFDAYVDALEALIDEYGTGDEILDDVYDRFDDVDDELSSLRATQSKASSQRSRLKQRLDEAHEGLDDVRAEVDDVRSDVGDVRTEVDEVETEVDDLWSELTDAQGDIGDVQAEVEEVDGEVEALSGAYDDLHDDVSYVEATVTTLQEEIESVRDDQSTELEAVRSELSSVRSDLAELRAIIDSLGDVFNTEQLEDLDTGPEHDY